MEREWTPKQLEAITREGDLLVSAAAGAGKTAVLTERIARLISEGVDPSALLVVTFTNAAAAEMKERIEARLRDIAEAAAKRGEEAEAARLRKAAADCARANISTLHSFCMNVLRRNYHEAGLDPAFEVAENVDKELLAAKAMEQTLEEAFLANEKENDPAFEALMGVLGNNDRSLEKLLRDLYDYAYAKPDPDAWLDSAVLKYTDEFPSAARAIGAKMVNEARQDLEVFMHESERIMTGLPEEQSTARAAFASDRDLMLSLILQTDHDRWVKGLAEAGKHPVLRWKNGMDPDAKEEAVVFRDQFKEYVKKLKKQFAHTLEEEAAFAAKLAPSVSALRELERRFASVFRSLKEEAGVIDFSDMEQLTLRALKNPGIAEEYRSRFHSVFVDEYQDINPAQEAILRAVSKDNRFMVGDVKQSIYRFRQAEPAIFLEKYTGFKGEEGHFRIDLNANFRSRTAILDAANLLFMQLMRGPRCGEIDYSDNASLVSGRDCREGDPAGAVEIAIIDPGASGSAEEDEGAPAGSAELQAAYAAARILDIKEHSLLPEGEGSRPYKWSDFAVLLRGAKGSVADWTETFARNGIPCVSPNGDGFYDALEVRLFLDLLRVIDNRRQDIPLLAVMRSPIFGFTEEDLVRIRIGRREEKLIESVEAAAADPAAPSWSIKCAELIRFTDRFHRDSQLMETGDLVCAVLDETGFASYVSALYGGASRRGNLELVCELARRYSKGGGSLGGFIRYMDSARETAPAPGAPAPAPDAVRLMTIHASKGLEFPVVILGDITKRFNRRAASDVGLFDAELGIGLCSVSGDREERSILQRAIALRENRRLNAEEMRLLYVAMTRAKERLIMTGVHNDPEKFFADLARPLDEIRIMSAGNYAEWILGAYFPGGSSAPVKLPGGGNITLSIAAAGANAGVRASMSEEEFTELVQNASFADCSELDKRFDFRYPAEEDSRVPSKLSVTGLTLSPAAVPDLPRFMLDDRPLNAAERGTLTHRLLQLIPIAAHDEASVRKALGLLTERGAFTEREAEQICVPSVAAFFASDLGRRLVSSDTVKRELEFNLLVPASRLTDTHSEAPVVLQGMIDCCFMEDGAWVLVDHKTSRIDKTHTARTVAEHYRGQLELYAMALEQLTGKPVREKYVYLLSADEAVKL